MLIGVLSNGRMSQSLGSPWADTKISVMVKVLVYREVLCRMHALSHAMTPVHLDMAPKNRVSWYPLRIINLTSNER